MAKGKGLKITAWILLVLGLLIGITTHIAILAMGIPQEMLGGHATLNLTAMGLIILGLILLVLGMKKK